jgi:hypothetical protein
LNDSNSDVILICLLIYPDGMVVLPLAVPRLAMSCRAFCGIRNTDPQLKTKLQRLETQKRAALDSEAGHIPSTWHGQSLVVVHVTWSPASIHAQIDDV